MKNENLKFVSFFQIKSTESLKIVFVSLLFLINAFYATSLFLPLKISECLWFSDVFRCYRKKPTG